MTPRQLRRSLERKTRKLARKAGNATAAAPPPPQTTPTENEVPAASTYYPSPARQTASRENGRQSHGALNPETKASSAQNHTTHGLARHQATNFKLLPTEDPAAFETLKKNLTDEHLPSTETESIFINHMAESEWLANRALRLQDTCLNSETGAITDPQKFSLYMRYQTTHTRAFHKCLNDLLRLRREKRQADLGVEAEKREKEAHDMKKRTHGITLFQKDMLGQLDLAKLVKQLDHDERETAGFAEKYKAELKKRGLDKEWWQAAAA